MKTIDELLIELKACKEAQEWAQGKTFEEVYTTCDRGDWLCWLFSRTNPEDIQLLTLVKGHQANTVRHLMTDERSIKAVETAIAFGEDRATREELRNAEEAADAAYFAAAARYADCARAAFTSACACATETSYAAAAASASASAARAYSSYAAEAADRDAIYDAAEQANRQLTADIFRKYISIDKFKI